jgi:hypothetical protein
MTDERPAITPQYVTDQLAAINDRLNTIENKLGLIPLLNFMHRNPASHPATPHC